MTNELTPFQQYQLETFGNYLVEPEETELEKMCDSMNINTAFEILNS